MKWIFCYLETQVLLTGILKINGVFFTWIDFQAFLSRHRSMLKIQELRLFSLPLYYTVTTVCKILLNHEQGDCVGRGLEEGGEREEAADAAHPPHLVRSVQESQVNENSIFNPAFTLWYTAAQI